MESNMKPKEIRCSIYTGILQDGSLSQGFVPIYGNGMHAGAWVCPVSSLENREMEKLLDQITSKTDQAWAAQNTRFVRIEFKGTFFVPEPGDWDVIVTGDFSTATHGRLIRRLVGIADLEVQDGDTQETLNRRSISDRSVPIADRLKRVLASYSTDGAFNGPNPGLYSRQFPSKDHIWVGA